MNTIKLGHPAAPENYYILNLVFDSFDNEGKPLPNLNYLNDKLGGEYLILPFGIMKLTPPGIRVRICRLSEVNHDQNYYYFINHNCSYQNLSNGEEWRIPETVEKMVAERNLKIIFYNEHESFLNSQDFYLKLLSTIRNKKLRESLFYIANNSSQLYDVKSNNPSGINVFKTNYLIELVSKYIIVKPDPKKIITDKKFMFLCHNRRPKPHRTSLLALLNIDGLLNSNIIDWSLTYGINNDYNINSENFQGGFFLENEEFNNSFKKITKTKKLSYFECDVNWFNNHEDYRAEHHISLKSYDESYINIITESHFSIENVHITEKSFKPFYYFQIPIFVASYKHVDYLRKEHDLYLFDDLIDHSYDLEPDSTKRILKIVEEIKRLSNLRDEVKEYYSKNLDKMIHNSNYILNYKDKRYMDNFFISLCDEKKKSII